MSSSEIVWSGCARGPTPLACPLIIAHLPDARLPYRVLDRTAGSDVRQVRDGHAVFHAEHIGAPDPPRAHLDDTDGAIEFRRLKGVVYPPQHLETPVFARLGQRCGVFRGDTPDEKARHGEHAETARRDQPRHGRPPSGGGPAAWRGGKRSSSGRW